MVPYFYPEYFLMKTKDDFCCGILRNLAKSLTEIGVLFGLASKLRNKNQTPIFPISIFWYVWLEKYSQEIIPKLSNVHKNFKKYSNLTH